MGSDLDLSVGKITMKSPLSILILAAGKGVRMKSSTPKVLHPVGGVPMIARVLRTVSSVKPKSVCVIVGHGGDEVRTYIRSGWPETVFVTQKVLNGSGGAVRQALSWLKKQKGDVIVTCGDAPLIKAESLKQLVQAHRQYGNAATVLTALIENPAGYGRIVRGGDGSLDRIVEHLDATSDERNIREINTGTYCFEAKTLAAAVTRIKANNAKGEYYLTDAIEIMREGRRRVGAVIAEEPSEALGVNQRADLAQAEAVIRRRTLAKLMKEGVTIIDPASTFIGDQVKIGPDTVIWPQTFIQGSTRIGSRCQIGPWAHIMDCQFENDVNFKASFAEQAIVKKGARVGPYSRLRPKSVLGPNVHFGNFSEVKNTVLGEGAKVNHLSYLGDAKVGKNVNIGAGTITCNYDGIHKHPTIIHDHAFVGSNVNLIAPVTLGAHSVIGAGSNIDADVPAWALALERSRMFVKKDWAKKKFNKE